MNECGNPACPEGGNCGGDCVRQWDADIARQKFQEGCSPLCINETWKGEFADEQWHDLDCPNHTSRCCPGRGPSFSGYIYMDGNGVNINAHFSNTEQFKSSMTSLMMVFENIGVVPLSVRTVVDS